MERILLSEARLDDLRLNCAFDSDNAKDVCSVEILTGSLNFLESEAPEFGMVGDGDDVGDTPDTLLRTRNID